MDFTIQREDVAAVEQFGAFLAKHLDPHMVEWYEKNEVPRSFHEAMGRDGWFGFTLNGATLEKSPALHNVLLIERLAAISPGVSVATLAHVDLGLNALWLFGSAEQITTLGPPAVRGETLLCLGNTETHAGSDVANVSTRAEKVSGGWRVNGAKAYVTNGYISDVAVVTAVTDPDNERTRKMSMFLVDLSAPGVTRKKLNKKVWIPSDLSRITMNDVFVPDSALLGERTRGLQQVLSIFTHSRVSIAALALGTAQGAFELALDHARKRTLFGRKLIDFEAKSFEAAHFHARLEAARLMVHKAAWLQGSGSEFRKEASLAKYLAVDAAREVSTWAADLFGAASVVFEHPVHKFPLDAWAASLGEGTQDVQKLVIFRELNFPRL